MRYLLLATIGAAFVCSISFQAHALTITYTQDSANFSTLPSSSTNPTPSATSGTVDTSETGEVPDVYRSPFENTSAGPGAALSDGGTGLPGYQNLVYTSVEGGAAATYSFSSPENTLSLLWGSPDSWNTLEFFSGPNDTGTLEYSITGNELDLQTYGHDLVDFDMSGGYFQSVEFLSSQNAFEFADLKVSATPLPSSLPLFIGGFGALIAFFSSTGRGRDQMPRNLA
jgi:hypothetical protein